MRKILLTTDFSENAWNAIVYAIELFKNEKCFFHILHTYTPAFYRLDYMLGGPSFSAIPDVGIDVALEGLETTLLEIKTKYNNPKHQFKTFAAFNTLTDEILSITQNEKIDLIVMGTQGATGVKEIFLGTHTVHVLRKATKPVLVIPNNYKFKEIKSILFPSDYRTRLQKEELKILLDIARVQKASLRILNVKDTYDLTEDQKVNKKIIANHFKGIEHSFEELRGKLMPNAIHEYIAEHQTDFLAIMNHKLSFLERLIVRTSIDSIGYYSTVPFLVLPFSSILKTN
ncbi:universal stress protein [Cellulophaga sp. Hel_I_12]|uniref:universal stress protein n=1 Tax=Cellulophaga sp. Hel_I_12 TaxID=1249972 RepID=UPI0006482F74|nr:universal stress protein [Cellulophaga sp. Hel_I_12]